MEKKPMSIVDAILKLNEEDDLPKKEGKLRFSPKISGIRVDTEETINYLGGAWSLAAGYINYTNVPETIRRQYWWMIPGSNLKVTPDDDNKGFYKVKNSDTEEILVKVTLYEKILNTTIASMSPDDQKTAWVYINRKDLWQELVDYFGSEDKVWKQYIRWGH